MKSLITFAVLAAFPLAASADVSKEDIQKLVSAGISDDVILTYVRTHGPMASLSSDDLVDLKKAGASDTVLKAIVGDAPATAPAPAAAPKVVERVVEKPVYVPRTTYVYDTPSYYTTYPSYSYATYSSTYYPTYGSYRTNCYPSYRYSSYPRSRVYYSSGYRNCRPRYGLSVGFGW